MCIRDRLHSTYGTVSSWASVPQAHAFALRAVCKLAIDRQLTNILFLIDSGSLYCSLQCQSSDSSLINECWDLLKTLKSRTKVQVSLDKIHKHVRWHTAASLAKYTTTQVGCPTSLVPIAPAKMKQLINTYFTKQWDWAWHHPDPTGFQYRLSRRFWPQIDTETSTHIILLDRSTLSKVIQVITGHGYNSIHRNKVDPSVDPTCRFCLEEDEDTWHVVNECPAFQTVRHRLFPSGDHLPITHINYFPERVKRLPNFIREVLPGEFFLPS